MLTKDQKVLLGTFAAAIATANGHPDPKTYATLVVDGPKKEEVEAEEDDEVEAAVKKPAAK